MISFTITDGKITEISLIGEPQHMSQPDIVLLDDRPGAAVSQSSTRVRLPPRAGNPGRM